MSHWEQTGVANIRERQRRAAATENSHVKWLDRFLMIVIVAFSTAFWGFVALDLWRFAAKIAASL